VPRDDAYAARESCMFRVEVGLSDVNALVETVESMRGWLHDQRFSPLTFGYSLLSTRVLFRIDFDSEPQADAFAKAFDGAIIL
jgi:hypothetical protein